MTNLLPPIAKKRVLSEQSARLLTLWLLSLSLIALVLFFMLLPTWFMQTYQINSVFDDADFLSRIEQGKKQREQESRDVDMLLKHFAQGRSERNYSELISKLDELAGEGIWLDRLSFDVKNKITLGGVADTRNFLSEFRDRLASDNQFSAVELPLSNLVNDRDVVFTLTLTVK